MEILRKYSRGTCRLDLQTKRIYRFLKVSCHPTWKGRNSEITPLINAYCRPLIQMLEKLLLRAALCLITLSREELS